MKVLTERTQEEELARICDFPDCEVSLSYSVRNKRWCDEHSDEGRRQNNKRLREQRKLSIRPEGYKSNLSPSIQLTDSMMILYEDYKEPLKTVSDAKGEGYGYMGTLAMSDDREYIQCHICGDLYRALNAHIRLEHTISVPEYKKEFGLSSGTKLIGDSLRYDLQQKRIYRGQPEHLKVYVQKLKSGEIKSYKRSDYSLEWRNKKGLCPDQVLEKILDLKEKIGYIPSYEEFYVEYKGRYVHSIKYLHGSWSKAVHKLGDRTREDLRRHSEEDLIEELKNFQNNHNRIPMTSDFNRGLLTNKGTFIRKFGTLNNARVAAGMNAVVPMGGRFGNYKEITPEEYVKYSSGHFQSQTKDAIKARKRRERIKAKSREY